MDINWMVVICVAVGFVIGSGGLSEFSSHFFERFMDVVRNVKESKKVRVTKLHIDLTQARLVKIDMALQILKENQIFFQEKRNWLHRRYVVLHLPKIFWNIPDEWIIAETLSTLGYNADIRRKCAILDQLIKLRNRERALAIVSIMSEKHQTALWISNTLLMKL